MCGSGIVNFAKLYEQSLHHIFKEVLPKIQEKFQKENNKKVTSIRFLHDETKKGEEQFQSIAIFGTIVCEYLSVNNEIETVNTKVIIKMQIVTEHAMKWNNGGVQFINEIYLYDKILSYFNKVLPDIHDIFPRFVYGFTSDDGNLHEDIIILEDLSDENYRLAKSKSELSLDHILLALKGLGKFHACSHIMKSIHKEEFFKILSSIKNIRNYITDSTDNSYYFYGKNGERGLKYLENVPAYKGKLENVRDFLTNIRQRLPPLFKTDEKSSVLCHGDFCRNNMFFKYNDQGSPIDVKFFDMANIFYSSPVMDIAFFLYLNTFQEMRLKHWDTMIRTYHDSLKETCDRYSKVTNRNDIFVPTYEEILEEFKLKSMMAYLSCSFFLPMMMQEKPEDRTKWGAMSEEELIQHRLKTGGPKATKAVGEILIHIIDSEFI